MTEPQEPGGAGTSPSLPAPRQAPGESPARPGSALAHTDAGRADADQDDAQHTDAELLRLHVGGDPDAFGELFSRHRDRLWAVAVRTLSDPEDAADALQDAMISAFRRAGSFRGDSAVTTWLHRIVVNACLDRIRRRAARPEVSGSDERLLDVLASDHAGGDPAAGTDISIEVMAALRHLPHDQQVALVLVDMLDYPVADAAEVLGVAQGTVKSRCARGRARLLPRLAHLRQRSRSEGPGGSERRGGAGQGSERRGGAGPGSADRPAEPDSQNRNQIAPGSVLPAQNGGDEDQ